MLKNQLEDWINKVEVKQAANLDLSFDFLIHQENEIQEFHIQIQKGALSLNEGRSSMPIGLLEASDESIQAIFDLGLNPFESFLNLDLPKKAGSFELPDIYEAISVESSTPNGLPLNFLIYIEDMRLNIIETYEEEGDMHIWIKGDYLERLIQGDFRIASALFTGKIKIKNKRKLFSILTKLGLKF